MPQGRWESRWTTEEVGDLLTCLLKARPEKVTDKTAKKNYGLFETYMEIE